MTAADVLDYFIDYYKENKLGYFDKPEGPAWLQHRSTYGVSASELGEAIGINGSKGQWFERKAMGAEKKFDAFAERYMAMGRVAEPLIANRIIGALARCVGLYASSSIAVSCNPGTFAYRDKMMGASPDIVVCLLEQGGPRLMPVELKYRASSGEVEKPMPIKYFCQLSAQMLAMESQYGVYVQLANTERTVGDVIVCYVLERNAAWKEYFENAIEEINAEVADARAKFKKGKFNINDYRCSDKKMLTLELGELLEKCVVFESDNVDDLAKFLWTGTDIIDPNGNYPRAFAGLLDDVQTGEKRPHADSGDVPKRRRRDEEDGGEEAE